VLRRPPGPGKGDVRVALPPACRTADSAVEAMRHHGSPSRTRLLLALLGAVFGLQAADMSTLGATAPLLETGLGFSHVQIGALASTSAVVGVLATLPVGVLADRVNRVGFAPHRGAAVDRGHGLGRLELDVRDDSGGAGDARRGRSGGRSDSGLIGR
jgi:hypothetical protein